MTELLPQLWSDESGQDLVEYALIIALMSIALVIALGALATGVSSVYSKVIGNMS